MLIQKDYRFYAAHRNEELQDKCRNLHGHRYGIRCVFEVERTGSYSTLFGDFDAQIEPFLKEQYDHAMLIHVHDPLYETLVGHMQRTGETLRLVEFDRPTSVENLAHRLFSEITQMGFRLEALGSAGNRLFGSSLHARGLGGRQSSLRRPPTDRTR